MNDESGIKKILRAVKKDKSVLFLLLFLVCAVIYINLYVTAVFTRMIEVKELVFGIQVVKEIFTSGEKIKTFACVAALEFALYLYLSMNRQDYRSKLIEITPDIHIPAPAGQNQFGSAWWLKESKFKQAFKSQVIPEAILEKEINEFEIPSGGLVLGKEDIRKGERIYYLDTDTHVLCIGATRSGKTRCSVLPTIGFLGLAGESMIVTDIKGELSDYTRPYLESLGYEIVVINYSEPQYSDCWNYLQPICDFVDAGDIPAAIDATWDLTAQFVGEAKGEKIWNDGEASMIAASIMAVVYDNREPKKWRYRNLANVYYFLINMCKSVMVGKGKILPLSIYVSRLSDSHPAKGLLGVSDIAPDRTRGSFYTAAVMTLKLFTNPYIANMSSRSSFDPAELGDKKMAVFLVLPDDRTTYHSLATLFISQAYTILSKKAEKNGGRINNRVNVVADEFGNFSKLSAFAQMMTVGGGKGIRFYLYLQSLAQLEEKYEKTGARIVTGNCETWVYLQTDDDETLKEISGKLGKYTTQSYSTSANSNRSASRVTSTGSSNQLTGRELLTPDEVAKIKRPYVLVTSRNAPAMMYAPDMSRWYFNELFGMGDQEHNRKLRVARREQRVRHAVSQQIELWGIWNVIIDTAKMKQKEKEAKEKEKEIQQALLEQQNDQM
ncbi:MAG: type IV secretory system conjugative DNA transfer family protein [Bacteroidales bacterium]|nr:type IV secretory system conjugative DNA transfer family protein [Clostridium sp.]MCM1204956.1 type IV secretory system conjugative DNA transfer family protein [Bacteroidales bacterium]